MTVNPHLVQHRPFAAVLTAERPTWMPSEDLPVPGWHLGTGAFPVLTDPALKGGTDEQQ